MYPKISARILKIKLKQLQTSRMSEGLVKAKGPVGGGVSYDTAELWLLAFDLTALQLLSVD